MQILSQEGKGKAQYPAFLTSSRVTLLIHRQPHRVRRWRRMEHLSFQLPTLQQWWLPAGSSRNPQPLKKSSKLRLSTSISVFLCSPSPTLPCLPLTHATCLLMAPPALSWGSLPSPRFRASQLSADIVFLFSIQIPQERRSGGSQNIVFPA